MNILFISTWFPFPLDAGSRIRVHHLLRALAARNQVHLIAFVSRVEDKAFIPAVQSWDVQVDAVQRDAFWRDPRKAWRGYLSLRPRDAAASYSQEMAGLVESAVRDSSYDAIVAFQINAAPYALQAANTPRVFDVDNYMTRWMKEQARDQRTLLRKGLRWLTWLKSRHYEHGLLRQFDACTFAADRDRLAAQAALPEYATRMQTLPNGVDLERNRPGMAEPQPDALVFNGALTYYANANAMRCFCEEILPAVRARVPDVRLRITGRHDGVDLTGIAGEEGVSLTGFLEDVRPAVAGSWACVVPLREGGGTRLKILEALALGTPVVATSKGAEGLDVTHEHDILIADDPADFARQTVRLLGDPALRQRLAANGRALMEAKYGWDRIGARFCAVVEEAIDAGAAR